MGTTLAELFVMIRANADDLEKGLGDAEKTTKSAGANMAKFLGGAIVGGATVAAAAILAIGGKAWDVASDIDAAVDDIGASLGLSADEAKAYGQTIKDVYRNNFGDSIEDVGVAIENVAKQLNITADDPALQTITENAFRLRDVFGTDVSESVDAVKTLMENFGLTSTEAFDMLAQGYEKGLDRSGDFLDTIGEYSTQFSNGGATASEFFSLLESGMQGGVLGTDKAADAFKEFVIRIQDGSDLTAQSLDVLEGTIDSGMLRKLQDGSMSAADAFKLVIEGLNKIEDPLLRMQTGVGLLGTQYEDLGDSAILAMDMTKDWSTASEGSIAALDTKYTNLGSAAEGMWRKFTVGIAPAGEAMLGLVNDNLPEIQGLVDTVSTKVVEFINLIPVAIKDAREAWDEDFAGMQSTWKTWRTEVVDDNETLWAEFNQTFGDGVGGIKFKWEDLFSYLLETELQQQQQSKANLTTWLQIYQGEVQLWTGLIKGDWNQFWGGVELTATTVTNSMLAELTTWFGPGLSTALAGALNTGWEGMKTKWNEIAIWWNNTFGGILGIEAGTFQPDLGIVNPENLPKSPSQQYLDDLNMGIDRSQYEGVTYPGASTSTYKFGDIIVPVAAGVDPYSAGVAIGKGINDTLRQSGMR